VKAMRLTAPRQPLREETGEMPAPGPGQVLIQVRACGVCRTDLHIVDGELPVLDHPVVPGHEIVGVVAALGAGVAGISVGERIGVPWLGWTCGVCSDCVEGRENLCDRARYTGYTLDGGYAQYAVADERYCFALPEEYSSEEAAPLLCAGLIGYRAYGMAGHARRLGFYGFGSAAQILAQLARADGREVYAISRQPEFAMRMGATWAGTEPPVPLDAAIIFAPVGAMAVSALGHVRKGGSVICAGIHMSDLPSFPYSLLWGERVLRSVANLTRAGGLAFFERLRTLRIETVRTVYPLEQANAALSALRSGEVRGTAILSVR